MSDSKETPDSSPLVVGESEIVLETDKETFNYDCVSSVTLDSGEDKITYFIGVRDLPQDKNSKDPQPELEYIVVDKDAQPVDEDLQNTVLDLFYQDLVIDPTENTDAKEKK